jgi:hypothetical protein
MPKNSSVSARLSLSSSEASNDSLSRLLYRSFTLYQGCKLRLGDKLKLGKHLLKVLEIKTATAAANTLLSKPYVRAFCHP